MHGLDVILLQFTLDDGVVVPVDEAVLRGLVLYDAHLGIHIVLHAVVVAIQVVGGDVQQDGDVGLKLVHVVQLERAQLDDVVLMRVLGHLQCQTAPYVASQSGIVASRLEDVVNQRRGGGFAVAARDANHLRVGVTPGKLYFADDADALCHGLLHHWSLFRDARTLDDFVSVQNEFGGVMLLFPPNVVLIQRLLVFVFDFTHVRNKYVETFFLG